MRKLLVLLSLVAISAFAEPSFQQVEGLIEHQQYSAAESGLEQIIQNHRDLSQPRVLHVCICRCHHASRVKVEFHMLLSSCNIGQHEKCTKTAQDATDLNKTYICNCRCHLRKEREEAYE